MGAMDSVAGDGLLVAANVMRQKIPERLEVTETMLRNAAGKVEKGLKARLAPAT